MTVKFYADTPSRRARQVIADVWFLGWCLLWIWLAVKLNNLIEPLGTPGAKLEDAGDSLAGNMTSAADWVDGLPLVGDGVRAPFDRMSDAGQSIADAGAAQREIVSELALFLPLTLAFLAITVMFVVWFPLRLRFIIRATAAKRFLAADGDLDLFALRALSRQPLNLLAAIDPDPAGAWRRRDPLAVQALARLELRSEGLRIPGVSDT
jgi:hypothetical protein